MFCGRVIRRGIILSAYICPYCLGDNELTPAQRYRQHPHRRDFMRHLGAHLALHESGTASCPHPLCKTGKLSIARVWDHLHDGHGIGRPPERHISAAGGSESEEEADKEITTEHSDISNSPEDVGEILQDEIPMDPMFLEIGEDPPYDVPLDLVDVARNSGEDSGPFEPDMLIGTDFEIASTTAERPNDALMYDILDGWGHVTAHQVPQSDMHDMYMSSSSDWQDGLFQRMVDPDSTGPSCFSTEKVITTDPNRSRLNDVPDNHEQRTTGLDQPISLPLTPIGTSGNSTAFSSKAEGYHSANICSTCNKPFKSSAALSSHSLVHRLRDCLQSGCQEVFPTYKEMIRHMIKVHRTSPWICDYTSPEGLPCRQACRDASELRIHRSRHEAVTYGCKECTYNCKSELVLQRHVDVVHRRMLLYPCPHWRLGKRCQSAFDKNFKLLRHIRTCHQE